MFYNFNQNKIDWYPSPRGAGFLWNEKHSREFNHKNNIEIICRAHQMMMEVNSFFIRCLIKP